MTIGALIKVSLLDYPGEVAATIFINSCNFACSYCYNRDIVLGKNIIDEEQVLAYLKKRANLLKAVCVSGGEALLDESIIPFLQKIKQLNYKIKVDTNGANPQLLAKIIDLKLVDYIAMDIKTSLKKYSQITNTFIDPAAIKESIAIIKKGNVDYHFRTTIVEPLIDESDIKEIAALLSGSKRFYLQSFKNGDLLKNGNYQAPTKAIIDKYQAILAATITEVIIANY